MIEMSKNKKILIMFLVVFLTLLLIGGTTVGILAATGAFSGQSDDTKDTDDTDDTDDTKDTDKTMGWNCVDKKCNQELGGKYDSEETCLETCTAAEPLKYTCNDKGECVSSVDGKYTNNDCDSKCVSPTEPITTTYDCDNGICVPAVGSEGTYTTSNCLTSDSNPVDACKKLQPWVFNEATQTCNGVGSRKTTMRKDLYPYNTDSTQFVSKEVCESLSDFTTKYSCNSDNWECVSEGKIPKTSGLYMSKDECEEDCINDKSQCSDTNVIKGVCCGQKSVYNYTCHNKTTEKDCKSTEHCCWKEQAPSGTDYGDGKYDVCPWSCQVKNEKAQENTDDCFNNQYKCFFTDSDENDKSKTIYNMTPRGDSKGTAVGKDSEDGSCQGKKIDGSSCCRWVPYVEKSFPGDDWSYSLARLPCIKKVKDDGTVIYNDEC